MPDHHRIVREVSWHDLFPWLLLLRTCRLAAEFRRLVLASVGIVLTGLGWAAIDRLTLDQPAFSSDLAGAPQAVEAIDAPGASVLYVPWRETARAFIGHWRLATRPARQLFARQQSLAGFAAALLATVWAVAVWSICGGAICRLSAVQLGLDEQLSTASALRYALRKWTAYVAAPLMPLAMAALFTLPLLAAGFLGRADWGLLLAGIVWPLVLVFAVLAMLLLAGLALGFPLMLAGISADGGDSFDAISRSYTYVGQRPLNYLFYAIVSLAIGMLGWMIISTLAALALHLTAWGASVGSGEERWRKIEQAPPWLSVSQETYPGSLPQPAAEARLEGAAGLGAGLISFWHGCVRLLALAYAYSFFWTAGTGAYLLLRRDADAVELDEVLVEGEDDPAALPTVKPDAAGVNVLADEPK
jgi:hypothetical protein